MKSRIKKLLAAALALCLIAAMVPGAALAADTGNFSTVNETDPSKTEYHSTLAAAVEYATEFEYDKYKVITVTGDNVTLDSNLTNGLTLVVPNNKTANVSGSITVNGVLELSGTLNVAAGATLEIGSLGSIENNGTVVVAAGSSVNAGGKFTVTGNMEGNGDVTVGRNANAELKAGYEFTGTLNNSGTVTVNGTLYAGGDRGAIINSGKLSTSIVLNDSSSLTNSGEISGSVTVDDDATMTISSSTASVGEVIVNGSLEVNGNYNQEKAITVNDGADMTVTGGAYTANATLTVDGTLSVSGCDFNASDKLTVRNNATISFDNSDVSVSSYAFIGTTNVDNSTFVVGGREIVGSDTLDGSFVFDKDKDSSKGVITIEDAEAADGFTFVSTYKYVVDGDLAIDHYATVETELNVASGGTVAIGNGGVLSFSRGTNTGILTGSGDVTVQGIIYNENTANSFDKVSVRLLSGGQLYSATSDVAARISNATVVELRAPNGTEYDYSVRYSGGGTYTITEGTVTGGTGTINIASSAEGSSTVNFSVSTASGYVIDRAWYVVEDSSTQYSVYASGTSGSFQMPVGNITFYVSLKEAETPDEPTGTTYSISRITSTNGTFVVNANKADAGETVTITTSPNSGYKVSRVSVTGATATKFADNVYIFTMPAQNVTVSVTFERGDYTVTLTNYTYDDGRISLSSGTTTTGRYAEGERVYIYAYPDRDFYVRSLTITRTDNRQTVNYYESSSSDDVFYFDMPASDVTVRAYFTDGVYEIATDIDGSGRLTITGEDGNVTDVAEEGEEIRITASPSNNYRLGDIYVNYTDSDDEDQVIYPEVEYKNNGNVDYYWFEMPEYDVEIYADFGEGDYVAWIDRSDMENGTIRVSPNVADEDDTVSIYVTPDTGYQLDELIVEDEDGHDVTTTSLASGTRYTFRMPDSDVTVTATFKSRSYSSNFTDVPRYEWYYEAVSYVASEGLMNGVSTTQFNPNGTASRAQIVTILWRLAGEPSALTGAFTDVPAGQYYSTAVAWASRQGIVTGVGNNRFEPNSNITREQLAVILYRYAQDAGYTTSASANITGYYDYARVNSYARTAMSWAVGAGLITGTSTTTLSPQDTATRAQVATILMRFCENIAK